MSISANFIWSYVPKQGKSHISPMSIRLFVVLSFHDYNRILSNYPTFINCTLVQPLLLWQTSGQIFSGLYFCSCKNVYFAPIHKRTNGCDCKLFVLLLVVWCRWLYHPLFNYVDFGAPNASASNLTYCDIEYFSYIISLCFLDNLFFNRHYLVFN